MAKQQQYTTRSEYFFVATGITKQDSELTPEEREYVRGKLNRQCVEAYAKAKGYKVKFT